MVQTVTYVPCTQSVVCPGALCSSDSQIAVKLVIAETASEWYVVEVYRPAIYGWPPEDLCFCLSAFHKQHYVVIIIILLLCMISPSLVPRPSIAIEGLGTRLDIVLYCINVLLTGLLHQRAGFQQRPACVQ